jgi:hypothetical protein
MSENIKTDESKKTNNGKREPIKPNPDNFKKLLNERGKEKT